ncbi:unnamed protein product [Caenorhabditis brenneri]
MHLEHPKVLTDTLHIITVVAVPVHIFGTYCILFKTPKAMGSGKWIMLNFHFWCMLLDYGITVLAVPLMLFPALAGIPYGILKDLGAPVEFDVYLVLALLAVVSASIITIFENRYFLVFAENTKWRYWRYPLSVSNYFICLTWCLPAFFFVPDQKMAIKVSLDVSKAVKRPAAVSVYMTSIQVPIVYVFISILFKIYNQAANNMVFVIFSFNGVSSTIVMIWIHKPYRDFCFKLLRIGEFSRTAQTRVNSQGTTMSVAANVI